jgi:TRAP-type C4-dicarboxylate transport system permease large subunit
MGVVTRGSLPFAIIISACSDLLFLFPEIALWLPRSMSAFR